MEKKIKSENCSTLNFDEDKNCNSCKNSILSKSNKNNTNLYKECKHCGYATNVDYFVECFNVSKTCLMII